MRLVIQRVLEARVETGGRCVGSIGRGLLVLLGVGQEDTRETADKYIDKLIRLRIFEDENGKTNLALEAVKGEILVVSQFTLYADCRKGNRPAFTAAGDAAKANELYEYVLEQLSKRLGRVQSGEFGADMKVSLVNDGPFTIVLDEQLFDK